MIKSEIIEAIKIETGLHKKDITEVLDAFELLVKGALAEDNEERKFSWNSFFSLEVVDKAERNGVNPSNGEKILIPAGSRIKFKAGSGLKSVL